MKIILAFFLLITSSSFSQFWKKPEPKTVIRTGPYIGIQAGRYYTLEAGMERQWKKGKWKNSTTMAIHGGANAAIGLEQQSLKTIIGFDMGTWYKSGTFGFTYGIAGNLRADLHENYMAGLTPSIGFKVLQLHLSTGYQILTPISGVRFPVTTLFLGARYVFVTDKEVKSKKKDK
ncbi:MAG: hypothetical protein ACKO6J_07130 [Crocinitomicaceae bacterium]